MFANLRPGAFENPTSFGRFNPQAGSGQDIDGPFMYPTFFLFGKHSQHGLHGTLQLLSQLAICSLQNIIELTDGVGRQNICLRLSVWVCGEFITRIGRGFAAL